MSAWMRQNVLGLVAIFIALSGTAFAATVAKNSVTSKSIKPNAVRSGDVRNETLTADDIADSATADLRGPQGPQGERGPQGIQGEQGPAGPASGPAGGALTGTYPAPGLGAGVVGPAELSNEVRSRRIDVFIFEDPATQTVLTLPGGTEVRALCFDAGGGSTQGTLFVRPPSGATLDAWTNSGLNVGQTVAGNTSAPTLNLLDPAGGLRATGMGTFVVTTPGRTFVLDAAAVVNADFDTCSFTGAATPAT